ncbi:MAG: DHH family phosphoesterase [Spirochaetales bacterium]|jgi:nanoRNase/pAp phosphatase (c-di-AMP/oligoRNAs hydrolase)|nr:DHH family phosphoesterase [Spirochaetales bacterium]
MPEKTFRDLLAVLDKKRPVIIQAHDYPDYDALAAGYSLLYLLGTFGVSGKLCYSGEAQGFNIQDAVSCLKIPVAPASSLHIDENSQVILVDGFVGNKNVTSIDGVLTAIVDHHPPPEVVPACLFTDIRPEIGSCSTIIYQYYLETITDVPRDIATALLAGIMLDTGLMTRGVSPADLAAFSGLFFKGDWEEAAYVLRNSFSLDDIPAIRNTMESYHSYGSVCFVELKKKSRPELLGLVADLFLRMHEIHFVVALSLEDTVCRISMRSEAPKLPADLIIRRTLEGQGSGGGHYHMSGGSIPLEHYRGSEELRRKILSIIEEYS